MELIRLRQKKKVASRENIRQWKTGFSRTDILSNGQYDERTFRRKDILPKRQLAENREILGIVTHFSKMCNSQSLCNYKITLCGHCHISVHKWVINSWYYTVPDYTVPDSHGHDIKLNSFKTNVALRFMIVLQNLITTNHRRSVKSKYDRKLTELNVVTKRIRYRVNRV